MCKIKIGVCPLLHILLPWNIFWQITFSGLISDDSRKTGLKNQLHIKTRKTPPFPHHRPISLSDTWILHLKRRPNRYSLHRFSFMGPCLKHFEGDRCQ